MTVTELGAAIANETPDARLRRKVIRGLCPRGVGDSAWWVLNALAVSAPQQFDQAVECERQARP